MYIPVQPYPDTEVPTLQPAVRDLSLACGKLALIVLRIMGCALKLNVRFISTVDGILSQPTCI